MSQISAAAINESVVRKWKRYPIYKDSGVEWLGKIPAHWEVKRVKYISCIFIPQRNKPELNTDIGLPWITMDDITLPFVDRSIASYCVSKLDALKAGSKTLPPGCVIASCVGNFGVASINTVPVIINQQLQAYIPKQINPWFLRYFVSVSKPYFEKVATATTLVYVNRERFGELPVISPPFAEQQAIASFLDRETAKIDTLIAKKEQLIQLLQEKRTALISHVVTKGLNPDVPMKDSGVEWLGEIPAHWEVRRNKTLFKLFNGYAFKGEYFSKDEEDAPVLVTPGNFLPDGGLYFTGENTTYYTGNYPSDFGLKQGDQLVVMTDLSYKKLILGQCITVDREGLLLNQRVAKIIVHKNTREKFCPCFLSYALNSKCVREQVISTARGATVFHSSPDKIGECLITLPSLTEQKIIVKYLDQETAKINALIAKIHTGIEQLKEYRTALISSAVTGKIDIRVEA